MRVRCGVSCGGACELIADGGTLGVNRVCFISVVKGCVVVVLVVVVPAS